MLVLTRHPNQRLLIGPNIVVTVVEVRGDAVKLGIEAPRDVPIVRPEAKNKERKGEGVA